MKNENVDYFVRSIINQNSIGLTAESAAVHILRKKKNTKSQQHAFLLLEYLDLKNKKVVFERYDLVQNTASHSQSKVIKHSGDSDLPNIDEDLMNDDAIDTLAQIFVLKEAESPLPSQLYIDNINDCVGMSYPISMGTEDNPDEFEKLLADIKKDMKTPPNYFVSGNDSFFKGSDDTSQHNCFTWCREKINRNTKYQIEKNYFDKFFAISSYYLKNQGEPTSGSSCLIA